MDSIYSKKYNLNCGPIPYSGDSAFKRTVSPVAGDIFEVAVHFGRAPTAAHIYRTCGRYTFVVCHAFVGKWEYTGLSLRGTIWVLRGKNNIPSLRYRVTTHNGKNLPST